MVKKKSVALLSWILAAAVMMAGAGWVLAQTAEDGSAPAAAKQVKVRKAKRPFQLRLPAHFGKIVDETQRQKIYDIQREYGPKIQELRAQLKALIDERDKKIQAVLSADQVKELAKAKEAARAKRKKKTEAAAVTEPAK